MVHESLQLCIDSVDAERKWSAVVSPISNSKQIPPTLWVWSWKTLGHWGNWAPSCSGHAQYLVLGGHSFPLASGTTRNRQLTHSSALFNRSQPGFQSCPPNHKLELFWRPCEVALTPKTVYLHLKQNSFLLIYKIHFSNRLMDGAGCVLQPELSLPEFTTRFKSFHLLMAAINIKTCTESNYLWRKLSLQASSLCLWPYRRCLSLRFTKHPTNAALHSCPHLFRQSWH